MEDYVLLTERVNNYLSENNVSIREFANAVNISKSYLGDTSKARIETYLKEKGY